MLSTRPKARQGHLRSHVVAICALGAGQCGLALAYADGPAAGIWAGIVAAGLACGALVGRLPSRSALAAGVAYATGAIWVAHLALPLGTPTTALHLGYCLTLFAVIESHVLALAILAVTVGVPALAIHGGHLGAAAHPVPAWMSAIWTLLAISTMAQVQFSRSRRRLMHSLADLRRTRLRMLKVQQAQQQHQRELACASEAYRAEIDALTAQMMEEARLTESLRARQDDKRSVVQAIHHDLREPLRSIVSFTQLARRKLARHACDPSLAEYLAFAEDGGRRMAVMLADLMSYTNDGDQEQPVAVDLDALCAEVLHNLHDSIARTGARVTFADLPAVEGQRTQLLQLLQNLLSNALKFSHPGVAPRVEVSAVATPAGRVEVRVADSGIGIPPNQLDKVFGLFNRAHAEHAYEGSGVGLALCRRIVIAHGGQIRVASAGAGTQFSFDLPAARGPKPGVPAATPKRTARVE